LDFKHARSADFLDSPIINPKYFENEADILVLVEALKFANKLVHETEPLKSMIVSPTDPPTSAYNDDKVLKQFIKQNLETAHHPIGTASMLPKEDGGRSLTFCYQTTLNPLS
jgi:choline dehydrogenase-like flavoprotein